MNKSSLKQLIREEIQNILSEQKLNMQKVFKILKTSGYNPRIYDGNRLFIKGIEVTGKGNNADYGRVRISPSGALYGDDLWGMDIETEEQIIPALEAFVRDQREQQIKEEEHNLLNKDIYTVWVETDGRFHRNFIVRAEDEAKAYDIVVRDNDIAWDEVITNLASSKIDQEFIDTWGDEDWYQNFINDPSQTSYLYDAGT